MDESVAAGVDQSSDSDGITRLSVTSPYQNGPTTIRVLSPRTLIPGSRYPVLYLLPVEAGSGSRYGDGLVEAQRLELAEKHAIFCVAPAFSQLPWYADHPEKPEVRQESHFVKVVVPTIDQRFPVLQNARGRLLVGFSKSGWGAFTLLLRHPELFGRAAAWDAPLAMQWPSRFGSAEIFGTADNFEQYCITRLLDRPPSSPSGMPRLMISGYGSFRAEMEAVHRQMNERRVPHRYLDGPPRKHDWHSGWLEAAVRWLVSD